MSASSLLPEGFEQLEPFVETWSLSGAANRARRRLDSTEEERVTFFNVACELAGPALDLLDSKPLDKLDEREKCLMNLMLTLAHVSLAVEIQGEDEPKHAENARHVRITRAVSDVGA